MLELEGEEAELLTEPNALLFPSCLQKGMEFTGIEEIRLLIKQ